MTLKSADTGTCQMQRKPRSVEPRPAERSERHLSVGSMLEWLRVLVLAMVALSCAGVGWAQDVDASAGGASETPLPTLEELQAAGATIGEIRIVVGNVFDTTDPREDSTLFRSANKLHITTRAQVIERRLLLRRGDRLTVQAIEESERVLRTARYLYDVRIRPLAYRDGVVDLEVATRDTWTLYPSISVSRSGGANKSEVSINELNLLGTGSEVSFGYFRDVDRSGQTLDFGNDNLFGRWVALQFGIGRNSDGSRDALSLVRPFYQLDARWAAGIKAVSDDRLEPVYTAGEQTSEYRAKEQSAEVFGGWSRGLVDGWVQRYTLGLSLQDNVYGLEPGSLPPPDLPPDEKLVGPYLRYQVIEDRYLKTENRNQMGRPEFFAVGLNSTLQLGWASTGLGSTYDALLYQGTVSRGYELRGDQTLLAAASIKGQLTDGEVRRQQFGAGAKYYLPHHRRWVFYASASGDLLTQPDPSDVLYLGGDNGLRGYPLRYQGGTQRALFTVEERLYTAAFPWRLFRVGAAAYMDVGRAWGGDNTNTVNPGWLANVGVGLRFFSVRTGFGNVLHLDLAAPINPTDDLDSVQVLLRGRASF
jgi:outer membrane protein assembly factor BamA